MQRGVRGVLRAFELSVQRVPATFLPMDIMSHNKKLYHKAPLLFTLAQVCFLLCANKKILIEKGCENRI